MKDTRFDLLGNEVKVGDEVVILEPQYRDYVNGKIIKFTPKGFRVEYKHPRSNKLTDTFTAGVFKGKLWRLEEKVNND